MPKEVVHSPKQKHKKPRVRLRDAVGGDGENVAVWKGGLDRTGGLEMEIGNGVGIGSAAFVTRVGVQKKIVVELPSDWRRVSGHDVSNHFFIFRPVLPLCLSVVNTSVVKMLHELGRVSTLRCASCTASVA